MKTTDEWEEEIMKVTMKIQKQFPELSKYISEMPENFSRTDKKTINKKNLKEYHDSLVEILKEYSKTHSAENT